jgi:hypothetical protein
MAIPCQIASTLAALTPLSILNLIDDGTGRVGVVVGAVVGDGVLVGEGVAVDVKIGA